LSLILRSDDEPILSEEITKKNASEWFVYIIRASDHSLYTGITTDIERRFTQHREGKGAKYFYGRQPEAIVFSEGGHSRSSASVREAEIKSFPKSKKWDLIHSTQH